MAIQQGSLSLIFVDASTCQSFSRQNPKFNKSPRFPPTTILRAVTKVWNGTECYVTFWLLAKKF